MSQADEYPETHREQVFADRSGAKAEHDPANHLIEMADERFRSGV